MVSGLSKRFLGVMLRGIVLLAALEALVLAGVEVFETLRRRLLWGKAPEEGFPWEEQPEIELESGEERIKLYPDYSRLYEDMLAEVEKAEDHVFVETFMWLDDEVGRGFVDALARKAQGSVRVYAIFDELANLGQPESFKDFPEGINALRFRSFSGSAGVPLGVLNPRNLHRTHRKILAVDGRVAFGGGFNIGELFTCWRGTLLRLRGAGVRDLERAFVGFWNTHRTEDLPEHRRPAPAGVEWGDELPHEREVDFCLQPTVEVVLRDQVLERDVGWKRGEATCLRAHHGALWPPATRDGRPCYPRRCRCARFSTGWYTFAGTPRAGWTRRSDRGAVPQRNRSISHEEVLRFSDPGLRRGFAPFARLVRRRVGLHRHLALCRSVWTAERRPNARWEEPGSATPGSSVGADLPKS